MPFKYLPKPIKTNDFRPRQSSIYNNKMASYLRTVVRLQTYSPRYSSNFVYVQYVLFTYVFLFFTKAATYSRRHLWPTPGPINKTSIVITVLLSRSRGLPMIRLFVQLPFRLRYASPTWTFAVRLNYVFFFTLRPFATFPFDSGVLQPWPHGGVNVFHDRRQPDPR